MLGPAELVWAVKDGGAREAKPALARLEGGGKVSVWGADTGEEAARRLAALHAGLKAPRLEEVEDWHLGRRNSAMTILAATVD